MDSPGQLDRLGMSAEDIRNRTGMEDGSYRLLRSLWKQHPHILTRLTGRLGP